MNVTTPHLKQPTTTVKVDQMSDAARLIYESATEMRQAAGQVDDALAANQRWLSQFLELAKGAIDERLDRLERIMVQGGHVHHTAIVCAACGRVPSPNCPNYGQFSGCGVPVVIALDTPKP